LSSSDWPMPSVTATGLYRVVRGVGVASDGGESSLLKPKVEGQVLAIERAWSDAGLDPETVGLVEAHGTATPTGDDAELRTLGDGLRTARRSAPTGRFSAR